MEGNPYQKIIENINEQISRKMLPMAATGIVTSVYPLTISSGNVILSNQNGLLVAADLLPRTRKAKITNPDKKIEIEAQGAINNKIKIEKESLEAEITIAEQQSGLQIGDRVLLITADQNIYTIICKVVSA